MWKCEKFLAMSLAERYRIVNQKKVCHRCLNEFGHSNNCKSTTTACNVDGCTNPKSHNRVLHSQRCDPPSAETSTSNDANNFLHRQQPHPSAPPRTANFTTPGGPGQSNTEGRQQLHYGKLFRHSGKQIFFQIIPVNVHGPAGSRQTHALIDSASASSWMESSLSRELGYQGPTETIELHWTGGVTRTEVAERINISISGDDPKKTFQLPEVLAIPILGLPEVTIKNATIFERYQYLRGLPLSELINAKPEMIIGARHAKMHIWFDYRCRGDDEPIAVKTPLGWTLFGHAEFQYLQPQKNYHRLHFCHQLMSSDEKPADLKEQHVTVENFGSTSHLLMNKEDQRDVDVMQRTIIPHLGTINENKDPPKPHNVKDVSAEVDGIFPNKKFLRSPASLAVLIAGFFLLCEFLIAFKEDVKKMFPQVQILPAIRSLIIRRGTDKTLRSDINNNLVETNNILHNERQETARRLGAAVASKIVFGWKFIPAYFPWFGGAWESLINTIKKSFAVPFKDETITDDVFKAALTQAELDINRRPLTHTPIDHEDSPPLTPNDKLFGCDGYFLQPPGEYDKSDRFSRQQHRKVRQLGQKFSHRWITKNLPKITRRSTWFKDTKPIEEGDIVTLLEPNEYKTEWHRGRVVTVHARKDGISRVADVQLADKSIRHNRSVGRLSHP